MSQSHNNIYYWIYVYVCLLYMQFNVQQIRWRIYKIGILSVCRSNVQNKAGQQTLVENVYVWSEEGADKERKGEKADEEVVRGDGGWEQGDAHKKHTRQRRSFLLGVSRVSLPSTRTTACSFALHRSPLYCMCTHHQNGPHFSSPHTALDPPIVVWVSINPAGSDRASEKSMGLTWSTNVSEYNR